MKTDLYQPRFYRDWVKDVDLISFNVVFKETDLCIRAKSNLRSKAVRSVIKYREALEKYIAGHPAYVTALTPVLIEEDAPVIVRRMAEAAAVVGVGPMAAVAGAIAEMVGNDLLHFSSEVIVENGGDIFMKIEKDRLVAIYAGESPFSARIAVRVRGKETPLGIATSSGTVGHSLSFGNTDASVVIAESASLADAAATALGNRVVSGTDIAPALEWVRNISGVHGALVIRGGEMGVWGRIELVRL